MQLIDGDFFTEEYYKWRDERARGLTCDRDDCPVMSRLDSAPAIEAELVKRGKRRNSMKLNDTVKLMKSEDWKDRFRAEYWQTVLRYDALHQMCVKYAAGTLDFEPNCSLDLLKQQRSIMSEYLDILEIRSQIEGVDLGVEE